MARPAREYPPLEIPPATSDRAAHRRLRLPRRKLAIELDGSQHIAGAAADARRDDELAAYGYRVIRFWNNDILENLEGVLMAIQRELEQPPPHPDPLRPQGRRGR